MQISSTIALHEIRVMALGRTSWTDESWDRVGRILKHDIPSFAIRWLVDIIEESAGDFDSTDSERIEVLRWLPPTDLEGELAERLTMPWTATGVYIKSLLLIVSNTYEDLVYREPEPGLPPRFELRLPSKPWPLDDLVSAEDVKNGVRRVQIYLSS